MNRLSKLIQLAHKTAPVHEVDEGADETGSYDAGINGPRQVFGPGPRPLPWMRTPKLLAPRPRDVEKFYEPHQGTFSARMEKLVELKAKTDAVLNFDYGPDDGPVDQRPRPGIGAAGMAGAGLAGAGGLYAAGAMAPYAGAGVKAAGLTGRQTIAKLGQNLSTIGSGGLADAGATIARGAGVLGGAAKGFIKKIPQVAEGLFDARMDRIITLRAITDREVNFEETDEHRTAERNKKYHPGFAAGAATGFVAGKYRHGIARGAKKAAGAIKSGAKRVAEKAAKHLSSIETPLQFDDIGETIRFESPMAEFNRGHRAIMRDRQDKYRTAKNAKRDARKAISDADYGFTEEHRPLQEKLHRESYVRRGAGIGALGGLAAGATLGALHGGRGGNRVGGALLGTAGAISGTMIGAGLGSTVGGHIRRKQPLSEV